MKDMRYLSDLFGLLADANRRRVLMLVDNRELCVCQIAKALDMTQPLVSHNLSRLVRADLLEIRREGKMSFYQVKKKLPLPLPSIMQLLRSQLLNNETHLRDLQSLGECMDYQVKTGKCAMEAFHEHMKLKSKSRPKRIFLSTPLRDSLQGRPNVATAAWRRAYKNTE
jgi:ArsR family transcriptional regulator, arsenate/arsenite/antimonite-responsive transcriptional repressor